MPFLAVALLSGTACGGSTVASSALATLGAELEVAPLWRSETIHGSVDSLVAHATTVVVGRVDSVESLGVVDSGEDLNPSEYFQIDVVVEDVITGLDPGPRLHMAWEGFVTRDGERVSRIVQQGVTMPDVGDRVLLLLVADDPARADHLGAEGPSWVPDTLDGILYIDGSTLVTTLEGDGRPAHEVHGTTLGEFVARFAP